MNTTKLLLRLAFSLFFPMLVFAQNTSTLEVFKNTLINFSKQGESLEGVFRLKEGRLILKKVKAPIYRKGAEVSIEMVLRSNGDPWDKSGSVFVFREEQLMNLLKVAQDKGKFPTETGINGDYLGIKSSTNYTLPTEILRFMTPFGVGHFSDESKYPNMKYYRPVYIPKWEEKVVWEQDITQLSSSLMGTFYIGVWIDTWTEKGYRIDLRLHYSERKLPKKNVLPLFNTVYYSGKIPDLFAKTSLTHTFHLEKDWKNAELYYITTGHGGHSGGDEFIPINNSVLVDDKKVIDFTPWRDDCASFRRFNPSSAVWIKSDTALAYNDKNERIKKSIEERLASSDISRSNWCPGSAVVPKRVSLGNLKKGKHSIEVRIPATKNQENQQNHWLVSGYIVGE